LKIVPLLLFLLWSLRARNLLLWQQWAKTMWIRWICVAAIFVGPAPQAKAGEVQRISCTVVRFYVAKYSAPAAEAWARNKGATEAEIQAARHCLKDAPMQTATDVSSVTR
jgi:hypothetical protein